MWQWLIRNINLAELEVLDIASFITNDDALALLFFETSLGNLRKLRLEAASVYEPNRNTWITSLVHRTPCLTSLKLATIDLEELEFAALLDVIGKQIRELMIPTYHFSHSDAEMLCQMGSGVNALYIGVDHCHGDENEVRTYEALSKMPKLKQLRIQIRPKIEIDCSHDVKVRRLLINSALDSSFAKDVASIFEGSTILESLSLKYMPEKHENVENMHTFSETMQVLAKAFFSKFEGQYCFKNTSALLELLLDPQLRPARHDPILDDALAVRCGKLVGSLV